MAAFVTVIFVVTAVLQASPFIRGKQWRDLAVFGFLLLLGSYVSIASAMHIDLYPINAVITRFVKSRFGLP